MYAYIFDCHYGWNACRNLDGWWDCSHINVLWYASGISKNISTTSFCALCTHK